MLSFLEAKTKLWSWSGVFTLEKCEVKIGSLSNHTSYQHILHKRACRTYKTVLGKSLRWKMEASSLKRWSQKKIDLLTLILRKWTLKSSTLPFTLLNKFFFSSSPQNGCSGNSTFHQLLHFSHWNTLNRHQALRKGKSKRKARSIKKLQTADFTVIVLTRCKI